MDTSQPNTPLATDSLTHLVRQHAASTSQSLYIMCDRDFMVTQIDDISLQLLQQLEPQIQLVFPHFSATNIVGSCVDQYHRDPAYIRQLLSNPDNLPHQAQIQVGALTLDIEIKAQIDAQGNYNGNVLEWKQAT